MAEKVLSIQILRKSDWSQGDFANRKTVVCFEFFERGAARKSRRKMPGDDGSFTLMRAPR